MCLGCWGGRGWEREMVMEGIGCLSNLFWIVLCSLWRREIWIWRGGGWGLGGKGGRVVWSRGRGWGCGRLWVRGGEGGCWGGWIGLCWGMGCLGRWSIVRGWGWGWGIICEWWWFRWGYNGGLGSFCYERWV